MVCEPRQDFVALDDALQALQAIDERKSRVRWFQLLSSAHHAKATPFVWTKSADEILASIARFVQRTLDFQAAPLIVRTTRSGH